MTVKVRNCMHCHGPITSTNPRAKWCGKLKCQAERKKVAHKKQYKRLTKLCPGCGCDITDLWPKRTCQAQVCIDIHERKKHEVRVEAQKRHYKRTQDNLVQIRKGMSRKGKRSLNKHSNAKITTLTKDKEYFDHSMYLQEQFEYHMPNGRFCNNCKEALYGNFYKKCPQCFKEQSNILNGGYDEI